MKTRLLSDFRPGDEIRGVLHVCPCCGAMFVGRKDAIYINNTHRMRYERAQAQQVDRVRKIG